jgi:hypothetical protein
MRYFLPDFPVVAEKAFWMEGGDISKIFNQKTHKKCRHLPVSNASKEKISRNM